MGCGRDICEYRLVSFEQLGWAESYTGHGRTVRAFTGYMLSNLIGVLGESAVPSLAL